jgi:hypothetical protein
VDSSGSNYDHIILASAYSVTKSQLVVNGQQQWRGLDPSIHSKQLLTTSTHE